MRSDLTSYSPKKHFGQNFLTDQNVKDKIINACDLKKEDTVLEIGPGKGVLTQSIAPHVKRLIAVETDPTLAPALQEQFKDTNITVVHDDFLKYDLKDIPTGTKVIGNLPYNISTPIIEKILMHRDRFSVFYLTVQWELGLRIAAAPDNKDYGAFSCFVQYYSEPKILFKIKNTAFKPVPKVQSCFLRLNLFQEPKLKCKNEELLFQITRQAFQSRRKNILNSLEKILGKEELTKILGSLKIDSNWRAENVSLENFVALTNALSMAFPTLKPMIH